MTYNGLEHHQCKSNGRQRTTVYQSIATATCGKEEREKREHVVSEKVFSSYKQTTTKQK